MAIAQLIEVSIVTCIKYTQVAADRLEHHLATTNSSRQIISYASASCCLPQQFTCFFTPSKIFSSPKKIPHSPTQPKNYLWVREFYEEKIFYEMKNFHEEKEKRILDLVVSATIVDLRCKKTRFSIPYFPQ